MPLSGRVNDCMKGILRATGVLGLEHNCDALVDAVLSFVNAITGR